MTQNASNIVGLLCKVSFVLKTFLLHKIMSLVMTFSCVCHCISLLFTLIHSLLPPSLSLVTFLPKNSHTHAHTSTPVCISVCTDFVYDKKITLCLSSILYYSLLSPLSLLHPALHRPLHLPE